MNELRSWAGGGRGLDEECKAMRAKIRDVVVVVIRSSLPARSYEASKDQYF